MDGKMRAWNKSVCEQRVVARLFLAVRQARQLLRLYLPARMVLHQGASSLKKQLAKSGAERRAEEEGAAQAGSPKKNAGKRQRMASGLQSAACTL